LLLRFHPERRRTGAATFVGRGTAAAAVVIIIVRRRSEKRRSVKRSKEREKKKVVVVLSLSHEHTHKQKDASSSRVASKASQGGFGGNERILSLNLISEKKSQKKKKE
jgi:hypothetical protein